VRIRFDGAVVAAGPGQPDGNLQDDRAIARGRGRRRRQRPLAAYAVRAVAGRARACPGAAAIGSLETFGMLALQSTLALPRMQGRVHARNDDSAGGTLSGGRTALGVP